MAKRPEIVIANGADAGRRYTVPAGGLRLGRSSSNDIHLPDEELSRNHCMFELSGEDGIRIIDLASANGTIVNGKEIGSEPVDLKAGDVIEVGLTTLNIVGEEPPAVPGSVDLGLGGGAGGSGVATAAEPGKKRSPFSVVLWIATLLLAAAAVYFMMLPPPEPEESRPQEVREIRQVVQEVSYEKVEADSDGIFRYEMTLSPDGVLKVTIDDVPKENRHLTKSEKLSEQSLKELNEILDFDALRKIDREYAGVESEPPKLESWNLKVVYTSRVRTVSIVNTREPEAFKAIREKLEAFSKNQLGIWAIQYSREKLIELAEEANRLGRTKWEDRDVQYGNLFGAVAAFKEAIFYLETVNPKPPCAEEAHSALERAEAELDKRYRDQRFLADRAINLQRWDEAQKELGILLEMVPERGDDRHREATAKLIDVEKRMKNGDK
jgi:hypothetical protein